MVDDLETIGGALEDIRAFCAVVEFGTVSAAGRQLGETKGSISRRISRLEARIGVTLLARAPRAVSPTEEGSAFYTKARESLVWLDDAVEGARESHNIPKGHLRITAPLDIGMEVLPNIVTQFRALHPQVTVELVVTDKSLDLAANRIDLAIRAQAGNLPDMIYRASLLAHMQIGLYAKADYFQDNNFSSATVEDLAEQDFVVSHDYTATARLTLTNQQGRTKEIMIRQAIRTSDYASALRFTLAGGGIGIIPDLVAAEHLKSGALMSVIGTWMVAPAQLYAISLAGRNAPARVRVFRAFVRKELKAISSSIH